MEGTNKPGGSTKKWKSAPHILPFNSVLDGRILEGECDGWPEDLSLTGSRLGPVGRRSLSV